MWVFTKIGFFSVVEVKGDHERDLVQAPAPGIIWRNCKSSEATRPSPFLKMRALITLTGCI